MVLKAACLTFIQEFKEEAGFNTIEKCATIASACNLFWRRDLIPEDAIAIEPLNGWCGANVNQISNFMVAFIMGVLNVSQTIATGNTIVIQIVPSRKSMKPPVKRHRSYVKQAIR